MPCWWSLPAARPPTKDSPELPHHCQEDGGRHRASKRSASCSLFRFLLACLPSRAPPARSGRSVTPQKQRRRRQETNVSRTLAVHDKVRKHSTEARVETAARRVSSATHQMTLENRWRRSPEGSISAQVNYGCAQRRTADPPLKLFETVINLR